MKTYFLYGILVVLGIFLAKVAFDIFSPQFKQKESAPAASSRGSKTAAKTGAKSTQTKSASTRTAKKAEPIKEIKKKFREATEPFILSGVYFEGETGYCIINDQIVAEGDEIEGAKVISISLEEVYLDQKGKAIRLTTRK